MIRDSRLNREVTELIAQTTTLTEKDLRSYRGNPREDPDHELYADEVDRIIEQIKENETTRRAIALADRRERCMVGVHILVREQIHVLSWLRSSDIDDYRDDDIGFLYWFGRRVRKGIGSNKQIVVHVFTSSLHSEVEDGE